MLKENIVIYIETKFKYDSFLKLKAVINKNVNIKQFLSSLAKNSKYKRESILF